MVMRALVALAALFVLGTDAVASNASLTKRNLMLYRRDLLMGGEDHIFWRRENPKEKYSKFCNSENRNKYEWNKVGMGIQLTVESNMFYDDGPCADGAYGAFGNRNFADAIHSQIEGHENDGWDGCTWDNCKVSDNGKLCGKGDDNPMWLWFLRSIEHFALFMDRLDQEVHWGFTNASSKIDPIVNHYSTKSSAEANAGLSVMIIFSAVLGVFGGVLGPVSAAVGTTTGAASGISGVGVGVVNGASATDPTEKVQAQLDRSAYLKAVLENTISGIRDTITHWGRDLINENVTPQNNPYKQYYYADQARSLPKILSNGDFAENKDHWLTNDMSKAIGTYFSYAALSWVYQQEKVFVVKVSDSPGGTAACDIDLDDQGITSDRKYCKDGVLYFLHQVKTKEPGLSVNHGFHLDSPEGIGSYKDDLGEHVTKETLIDSAIESNKEAGFFNSWEVKDGVRFYHEGKPEKLFHIPVCDLDKNWKHQDDLPHATKESWSLVYWNVVYCSETKDKNGKKFPYDIPTKYYV